MFRIFFSILLLLFSSGILLAQRTIVGKIIFDEYNEPIAGVKIKVINKKKGKILNTPIAISNIDGSYSITVPKNAKFLHFQQSECEELIVKIDNKDTINVVLKFIEVSEAPTEEPRNIKVHKPVIYLYPKEETNISLKVNFNGKFDFTYPLYNNGWNVKAQANGKLVDNFDGKEHNYLFWDGKLNFSKADRSYASGFVVHKDSLVHFFQKQLPQMGLLPHEYNDFIVYWTPLMQQNEWNFVHFRTGKAYDIVSTNDVQPKPDTEIRIFMDFSKLEFPFDIAEQIFVKPERNGFTLVEWGGADVSTIHIF